MKIIIVTYFFYPQNTPRAFRATELAKELSKQGHDVIVYIVSKHINNINYEEYAQQNNLLIHTVFSSVQQYSEDKPNKRGNSWTNRIISILKNKVAPITYYFSLNSGLLFYLQLKRKLKIKDKCDMLISIALPFQTHWVISNLLKEKKIQTNCAIADYGDPFSYNQISPVAFYFKFLEKRVTNQFNFITIPTDIALNTYLKITTINKIKIIPQGFCLEDVHINTYVKNKIITFAYAGNFYYKTRNPKQFFDYILQLEKDFKFIIFTDTSDIQNISVLIPYAEKLKDKLVIYNSIERIELIKILSTMDFLINFSNSSNNQIPSKLIDYSLTKRPFLSISQDNFNSNIFNKFLDYDFSSSEKLNIEQFDIKIIAKKFIDLASKTCN